MAEEKEDRTNPQEAAEDSANASPDPHDAEGPEDDARNPGQAEQRDSVEIPYEEYEQLRKAAEEREEYLQRLQRAVADYQNLQNRTQRQRAEAAEEGVRRIVRELLPVVDNLRLAIDAAGENANVDKLLEGLHMIQQQLKTTLAEFGIEAVPGVGHPFDPEVHEAMLQEPSDEHPPNTVIREFQRGYTHGDRILRPAKVVVSMPGRGPESDEQES